MSNLSNFRARYGNRIERLDYQTEEGVKSIYNLSVREEKLHAIEVEGTVTDENGGNVVVQWIHLDDVVKVYETAVPERHWATDTATGLEYPAYRWAAVQLEGAPF